MKFTVVLVIVFLSSVSDARYKGPTNQAGLSLIKQYEGFSANFYADPLRNRTIGYGHPCPVNNCTESRKGKLKVPLTLKKAEELLKKDLKIPEKCVKNYVTYSKLNANQFSALTSFTFSLNCFKLQSSVLLQKLNRGDVTGASNEFESWTYGLDENHQLRKLDELVRRREAERDLFCTGSSCSGAGDGKGSEYCMGKVSAISLNIRKNPNSLSDLVDTLGNGATVLISDRVGGTDSTGEYWFRIPKGYISAHHISIIYSNGASWCEK